MLTTRQISRPNNFFSALNTKNFFIIINSFINSWMNVWIFHLFLDKLNMNFKLNFPTSFSERIILVYYSVKNNLEFFGRKVEDVKKARSQIKKENFKERKWQKVKVWVTSDPLSPNHFLAFIYCRNYRTEHTRNREILSHVCDKIRQVCDEIPAIHYRNIPNSFYICNVFILFTHRFFFVTPSVYNIYCAIFRIYIHF